MQWMKENCKPTDEVNSFINKIVQMAHDPIEVNDLKLMPTN